jgi:phosphohistidine phosphatase
MDLILWRHAEAEDRFPDLERALTDKGVKQADKVAQWLRKRLPDSTRILVSPATRAQQTAEALTSKFETVDEIAPGASYQAILKAAKWPKAKGAVLVVGHQPALGQAASWVLSGEAAEWSIKKGALFWVARRARGEGSQVALRAAISPGLL